MSGLYVIDTTALISYFSYVFEVQCLISANAIGLIKKALDSSSSDVKLAIPSIVFIEIYKKWFTTEEFAAKFHYEVFNLISNSPNIEIKPIDREVLENTSYITDNLENHDIHDKIILASAIMLKCPLITTDTKIKKYATRHKLKIIIN
jgi:predicted nucleic acid-binding protein